MDFGAAQILRRDDFAGRRLDERRTRQKDSALARHDNCLVAHRRDIGATRRAASHHHRDLRDSRRRHPRLIVKDAAEMVAIGKDFVLAWQMGAAAIDEIDARQMVFLRDFLRAQMLLDGQRIIGAALDGCVIGDDDAFMAAYVSNARYQSRRRNGSRVNLICGELRKFQKRRTRINQRRDAIARQKFSCARDVPRACLFSAALRNERDLAAQILDQTLHRGFVRGEIFAIRRDGGFQNVHRLEPWPLQGEPLAVLSLWFVASSYPKSLQLFGMML